MVERDWSDETRPDLHRHLNEHGVGRTIKNIYVDLPLGEIGAVALRLRRFVHFSATIYCLREEICDTLVGDSNDLPVLSIV